MISKKAGMKWSIEVFLCILIVTAGVISVVIFFPGLIVRKVSCPEGQGLEIKKVWNKVEEVRGRPGYEIVHFKMKDCVTEITWDEDDDEFIGFLEVQYTTVKEPIEYPTNAKWVDLDGKALEIKEPGTYTFRVFADSVELVSE